MCPEFPMEGEPRKKQIVTRWRIEEEETNQDDVGGMNSEMKLNKKNLDRDIRPRGQSSKSVMYINI